LAALTVADATRSRTRHRQTLRVIVPPSLAV
jgi:hypothetical protein